ncbi:hypothetical protein ACVNP3_15090 [Pseudomonas chlororaphis subsp. piscium]
MNISSFDTRTPPSRVEQERLGHTLLSDLATHLKTELLTFKEHYVEEGSLVLTFRSALPLHETLGLQLEGVLLFDVRPPGELPTVDAELLLFCTGQRMGLQMQRGNTYLRLSYDVENGAWGTVTCLADAPEEWEGVTRSREAQYAEVVRTYDWS